MTKQQQRVYDYLAALQDAGAVPPSFEEIKVAIGFKSKSEVGRIVGSLEEQGLIYRMPYRARGIRVIDHASADYQRGFDAGYARAMREATEASAMTGGAK